MNDACVCIDIDVYPRVYDKTIQTARKEHQCTECGDTIKKGQKYEYVKGNWDGEWSCFKTCITCTRVRNDLFTCGHNHGSLWEDIYNTFRDTIPANEEDDLDWLR